MDLNYVMLTLLKGLAVLPTNMGTTSPPALALVLSVVRVEAVMKLGLAPLWLDFRLDCPFLDDPCQAKHETVASGSS